MSRIYGGEDRQYEERHRYAMPDPLGYEVLVYETWKGRRDDPATDVEQRIAVFMPGDCPPDGWGGLWVQQAYEQARGRNRYYSSYGYDGLPGAVSDEVAAQLQEADHEAEQFKRDYESAIRPHTRYSYSKKDDEVIDKSDFEKFMEAVDVIAENPDNEPAWQIIQSYRLKQLMKAAPQERG